MVSLVGQDRASLELFYEFPVEDFPVRIYYGGGTKEDVKAGGVTWHWHKEIQLSFIKSGTYIFWIRNQKVILSQGDCILIPSNVLHYIIDQTGEGKGVVSTGGRGYYGEMVSLNFLPDLLFGNISYQLGKKYVIPLLADSAIPYFLADKNNPFYPELVALMRNLEEKFRMNPHGFELQVLSTLYQLWSLIYSHYDSRYGRRKNKVQRKSKRGPNRKDNEIADQIIGILSKNVSSEISLEKIAQAVNLSQEECCRRFKKATGSTIFNYVTELKIQKAVELLLHTTKTIERISYEVGYSHTNYFIKVFRSKMGGG